ncbi:flavin reductase family protein [Hymenobacter guriensis]|uniref:Flavin reductase family protein n=1 Tax=Hymenobacter guriensis TaxID=2793065 RepID=A0ABS0L2B8_9BACT|nr:flavin reductase family protein [Hymenobacter guriensis]MBG8553574.1 flavin reductase family protein [Hymenobacter guriensis]
MPAPTLFRSITPSDLSPSDWHPFMVGAVAPRPVAFVSTVDEGRVNLSPYSFFNCFGSNPPILAFSPANRVRDNSQKHTLQNVREVPECVVHICDYAMVEQMSLASTEYAKGVNEFVKAGFTEVPSQRVRPPRVLEAPAAFECVVEQIIELGQNNGAGNLVLCRVVLAHFREDIILPSGIGIDPRKLDAVARLGGDWYSRSAQTLFEVPKPNRNLGIGFDQLPAHIRHSDVLTGNNLGRLANVEAHALPTSEEVAAYRQKPAVQAILQLGDAAQRQALMQLGKQLLESGQVLDAWKVLLLASPEA